MSNWNPYKKEDCCAYNFKKYAVFLSDPCLCSFPTAVPVGPMSGSTRFAGYLLTLFKEGAVKFKFSIFQFTRCYSIWRRCKKYSPSRRKLLGYWQV